MPGARGRRIVFISSNDGWGGSEELWGAAAAALARSGARVTVAKAGIDRRLDRIKRLESLDVSLNDLRSIFLVPGKLTGALVRFSWPLDYVIRLLRLKFVLWRKQPALVVLSQGGNFDGLFYGKRLRRAGARYCLIVQKAAEMYWPSDDQLNEAQALYRGAARVFFVSRHNLGLTEEQLAQRLPNAVVVRNPFAVPYDAPQPWPETQTPFRLACVGRLYPREKGQDILLRVLAREKWRQREMSLTLFGAGQHFEGLRQTASYLGLSNVTFAGFTPDVAEIWRTHHALVLPSHCEGLPLALVEAMLSGRVPIVTDVAGNGEVVTDNVTGFLASSASDDAVDEALERGWARRSQWPEIGAAAARAIRELLPPDPGGEMARCLADLAAAAND